MAAVQTGRRVYPTRLLRAQVRPVAFLPSPQLQRANLFTSILAAVS